MPLSTVPGECSAVKTPFLVPGSQPATGLFLDKLTSSFGGCGIRMPSINGPVSAADMECIQRWANALTAPTDGARIRCSALWTYSGSVPARVSIRLTFRSSIPRDLHLRGGRCSVFRTRRGRP